MKLFLVILVACFLVGCECKQEKIRVYLNGEPAYVGPEARISDRNTNTGRYVKLHVKE